MIRSAQETVAETAVVLEAAIAAEIGTVTEVVGRAATRVGRGAGTKVATEGIETATVTRSATETRTVIETRTATGTGKKNGSLRSLP